jgi:uncharacterized membrane protein YidH (DUF202 family)
MQNRQVRAVGIGIIVGGYAMVALGLSLMLYRDLGPALLVGIGSIAMALGYDHWRQMRSGRRGSRSGG